MSDPVLQPIPLESHTHLEFAQTPQRPLQLELRVPRSPAPVPLVIYISLAGLRSCLLHKTQWWLVEHGFAMASIDCRGSDEAPGPAAVHDCKSAVRWLRAHAGEFNYRADAIGVWGHSAGGLMAALLGTSGDVAALEGDGPHAGVSSRVQAVCDECGSPHDLAYFADPAVQAKFPAVTENIGRYLGGPVETRLDLAKQLSPRTYVNAAMPPMLLLHGDADAISPAEETIAFYDAIRPHTDATLRILPGQGHSWPASLTADDIVAFFRRTLTAAHLDSDLQTSRHE